MELLEERESLMDYARKKLKAEDFHAVADAMMDLREIDAKLEIINELDKSGSRGVSGS